MAPANISVMDLVLVSVRILVMASMRVPGMDKKQEVTMAHMMAPALV